MLVNVSRVALPAFPAVRLVAKSAMLQNNEPSFSGGLLVLCSCIMTVSHKLCNCKTPLT